MKITFDTNVLDKVCRPERFPKDPDQAAYQRLHRALKAGVLKGYYSVCLLTIEGVQRLDRISVFAGTQIHSHLEDSDDFAALPADWRAEHDDLGPPARVWKINMRVEQPGRRLLDAEWQRRILAAKELGFRVLNDVPRVGATRLDDPKGEYYVDFASDDALSAWLSKVMEVEQSLADRGVGYTCLRLLADRLALEHNFSGLWFKALSLAKDVPRQAAIVRAFSEWADGDSVAAHIAYGFDVFCTLDRGQKAAAPSVLDSKHRKWLSETYGARFMSPVELAQYLLN